MSNERVVVKFTQSWRGYSKGERAGFDAAQVKALIDGKVAEQVKAVPPAAAPKGGEGKAGTGSRGKGKGGAANTKPGEVDPPPPATEPPVSETGATPPPPADDDDDEPKP
ncbi:hypothetical protein [Stutzerimonas nitrititolerans]|uniref:hypothetical protein n=1 Tax=Stutzerimonas nitrititolerans TaxID=2482751 RepID=UPI0028A6BF80|nr:hypothetical protein [Stutzerimonas nitrititolerans]